MSVEQNLEEIMSARYGKDVRQSIHDAIYDINEVAKRAEFDASTAPASAKAYAEAALASEQAAQSAKQAAEEAAQQAMSGTPAGYADLVEEVRSLKVSNDTVLAESGTFVGRVLLDKMYGMSVQDGTPTPSVPVAIKSAKANFLNTGKNLLVVTPQVISGFTTTVNADKSITVNGSSTSDAAFIINYNNLFVAKTTKQLKVTGCPTGGGTSTYKLQLRDLTTNTTIDSDIGSGFTFTPIKGHEYALRAYFTANYTATNVTFKPMIALANADQAFEPYQGQSVTTDLTLRAIEVTSSDDYNLVKDGKYYVADTLEKIDGGYQITRRCNIVTLDGTENINWLIGAGGEVDGSLAIYFTARSVSKFANAIPLGVNITRNSLSLCNKLVSKSTNDLIDGNFGISIYQYGLYDEIAVRVSGIKTSAEMNSWLTSNNLILEYILRIPTVETVTNMDAKKLLSLKSYDEATYVAQTEDTEGVMVIEYGTTNYATKALSGYVEAEQNSIRLDDLEA